MLRHGLSFCIAASLLKVDCLFGDSEMGRFCAFFVHSNKCKPDRIVVYLQT